MTGYCYLSRKQTRIDTLSWASTAKVNIIIEFSKNI